MRYLSLFSGIEAATVAWHPLGWECVGVAEIEPFPSAVLAHHYPNVPNIGDVTKVTAESIAALGPIDLIVFGSPCFTAGHTILTLRGLIPIESVVVGDSVWTHASRWQPVTAVMTRTAPTVLVNGQGHNAMRATPDHPIYACETSETWNGNGYTRNLSDPQWVHASEMKGKRWATPVDLACDTPVPVALRSVEAAYLAGLYLGDGNIGRTAGRQKKSVIFSVGAAKREKILPRLRADWGTVSDLRHGDSVFRLQLSRTSMADALLENFGELSHAKSLPVWALCADAEWQAALLQGVLDTDGSPIRNGWRVTTVSRSMAVGLRMLAARLGYSTSMHFSARPSTCVIQGRTVNQRDTWTVALRKGNRTSELCSDTHAWGLVRSVTPCEDAQVYDITVANDHSFICDGIVVHNCQDLSVAGKRKGLDGARSGLFFTAMQIVDWARAHCGLRFALWENVPGAFTSAAGRDFAAVVENMAGLEDLDIPPKGWGTEGCAIGTQAMVEWCVLDAQWRGVAQRRRRVFALADFGDWASRPPILLESESMRGDTAPRRETGQDVAGAPETGPAGSDDVRPVYVSNAEGSTGLPFLTVSNLSKTVNNQTPLVMTSVDALCAFCGYPFDHGKLGKYGCPNCLGDGRGMCINAIPHALAYMPHRTLADDGYVDEGFAARDISDALHGSSGSGNKAPLIAFNSTKLHNTSSNQSGKLYEEYTVGLDASSPPAMQVRRLTVGECETLQGFPRGYTQVPMRGKPAADGPRYKALGNSMCVNVMRWIGKRLDFTVSYS